MPTYKQYTPVSTTVTAASAAALNTAITAAVNTLVQAYVDPEFTGASSGDVANGTIMISPTSTVEVNTVVTWYATIQYQKWIIPS